MKIHTFRCMQQHNWKHPTSSILASSRPTAQTLTRSTIRYGDSCSSEFTNVVWTTSMSWSSALLMPGMVCSRTSLTRRSASGEKDWKRAYVHRDDIFDTHCRAFLMHTLIKTAQQNFKFVFWQNKMLNTAKIVNFRVLRSTRFDSYTKKVRWGKWNYRSMTYYISD